MKDTIKITIALSFIIGAYTIGYYQGKETHLAEVIEKTNPISTKDNVFNVQDSINKLNQIITKLKTKTNIKLNEHHKKQSHMK